MSQLGYFSGQLLGTQLRTEKETVKNLNALNRYRKAHTLFICVRPSGALLTYFKHNSYNSNCLAFTPCICYLSLQNNIITNLAA